jgi:hypothetical protein
VTPSKAFRLLATMAVAGTAVELATDRHWDSPIQLIPWFALAAAVAALFLVARDGGGGSRRWARPFTIAVGASALLGIFEHVRANVEAGYLDATYGATWAARSSLERWWIAASGGVGPSPVLAPGVLLLAATATWFSIVEAERDAPSKVTSSARPVRTPTP